MEHFYEVMSNLIEYIQPVLIPLIYAIVLCVKRKEYGYMLFLYIIITATFSVPTWMNITFYSITTVFAIAAKDKDMHTWNNNINYNISPSDAEELKRMIQNELHNKDFDNIIK